MTDAAVIPVVAAGVTQQISGTNLKTYFGSYGNANVVANLAALGSNPITTTGNITAGNLDAINLVINRISSDDSSFVTVEDGVNVTGEIAATGNITGGNLLTGGVVSFAGGSRLSPIGANLDIFAGAGAYVNLTTSDESSRMGVDGGGGYIATAGGSWNFDTTGTLTVPATNVVPGQISTQTTVASEKGFDLSITAGNTNGCSVSGGDMYLSAGVGYNGISHGGGNVNIVTGDRYGNVTGNIWRFDSNGALKLPLSNVRIRDTVGNSVAFGLNAGLTLQGVNAVAIGSLAGNNRQGLNSVAIGNTAGAGGSVSTNYVSGAESPSTTLVVVSTTGIGPGMIISGTGFFGNITVVTVTNSTTLEISASAGFTPSGTLTFTGSQGNAAVAIGPGAGSTNQGSGAVALGDGAGQSLQGVNAVAIGLATATTSQGSRSVAIGQSSGQSSQGADAVAIGQYAGNEIQGISAVAIGNNAGYSGQSTGAVAIGSESGLNGQGDNAVAVGYRAGRTSQGQFAVAIGDNAGNNAQGTDAVAIGASAGLTTQGNRAVAIGISAGQTSQGINSIAIGQGAGETNQGNNSIILNATGAALDQTTANTFTVAPVRNDVANIGNVMFYNTTSKEITYGNVISVAGNVTAGNISTGSGSISGGNVNGNVFNGNVAFGNGVIGGIGNITGGNISVTGTVLGNSVTLNTSANVSVAAGQMAWNSADGTMDIGLGYGNVVLQTGQETHYVVRNETGTAISNGTAVYCSGVTPSGRISVDLMTSNISPVQFLGLATQDISNGVNGVVTWFGYVRDLDTRGTANTAISVGDETWAVGDKLYVHPTAAGKLTKVEPAAPNAKICVASIITRNQNSGVLFVRPTTNLTAADLSDVQITTPATNQFLVYVGNRWENTALDISLDTTPALGGNLAGAGFNISNVGNISVTGNITGNTAGFAIGYRDIPQVSLASNVTTALTDAGKHYYSTSASNLALTIADNSVASWPVGTAISVVNRGTANITVAPAAGVSLYLAGNATSGNRTVTTYGMATMMNVAANIWMISGTVV